jgi:hypothetical protein
MNQADPPIVHFHRLIEGARPPQRADRSAIGTLPTRAFRYCEPVRSATGFGWWVFPPTDLRILWDGHDIFWHHATLHDWLPLQPSAQFPWFADRFDASAPEMLKGCSPPFLTALPEPGTLQIWTGLMVRTAPDWSLLVRAPANLPCPGGHVAFEGIIESDRWFGPLFINLRLTRTHAPIRLRADFPLVQVQPLPRSVYGEATLSASRFTGDMDGFAAQDWADYHKSIALPNADPDRPFGAYAVASRKRGQGVCPMSQPACPTSQPA